MYYNIIKLFFLHFMRCDNTDLFIIVNPCAMLGLLHSFLLNTLDNSSLLTYLSAQFAATIFILPQKPKFVRPKHTCS